MARFPRKARVGTSPRRSRNVLGPAKRRRARLEHLEHKTTPAEQAPIPKAPR
jgi:hypothetical protein